MNKFWLSLLLLVGSFLAIWMLPITPATAPFTYLLCTLFGCYVGNLLAVRAS